MEQNFWEAPLTAVMTLLGMSHTADDSPASTTQCRQQPQRWEGSWRPLWPVGCPIRCGSWRGYGEGILGSQASRSSRQWLQSLDMLTRYAASALPQDPGAQPPGRCHGSSPPGTLRPWPAGERQGQSNIFKRGGGMLLEERLCAARLPAHLDLALAPAPLPSPWPSTSWSSRSSLLSAPKVPGPVLFPRQFQTDSSSS